MATAKKTERGPAPDLMVAIGVPKGKAGGAEATPDEADATAGLPADFTDAISEAFPELAGDPARMSALYDAIKAASSGGGMGGMMGR